MNPCCRGPEIAHAPTSCNCRSRADGVCPALRPWKPRHCGAIVAYKAATTVLVLLMAFSIFWLQACGKNVRPDAYRSDIVSSGSDPVPVLALRDGAGDAVSVTLKMEGRLYRVSGPSWGTVTLKRQGERIFIVAGQKSRLLMTLDEETLPWVMVADVKFDGEPEFFTAVSWGASNVFFALVDEQGRDIGEELFHEASPGSFGLPSFHAAARTLTTREKSGPVGAERAYVWKNGGYRLRCVSEPVMAAFSDAWQRTVPEDERDPVFFKRLVYTNGVLTRDYLSRYGADTRPLVLAAKEDIPLLAGPVAGIPDNEGKNFRWKAVSGRPGVSSYLTAAPDVWVGSRLGSAWKCGTSGRNPALGRTGSV